MVLLQSEDMILQAAIWPPSWGILSENRRNSGRSRIIIKGDSILGRKIWVLDLAVPEGMASKLFVNVGHQSHDGKFGMLLAHSTHRLSRFPFFPHGSGRWRWKRFVLLTSSSNLFGFSPLHGVYQHSASTSALKFLSSSPILYLFMGTPSLC